MTTNAYVLNCLDNSSLISLTIIVCVVYCHLPTEQIRIKLYTSSSPPNRASLLVQRLLGRPEEGKY